MLRVHFKVMVASFLLLATSLPAQTTINMITAKARVITSPVLTDADDAAIWMHPTDPSKSLVIGTDKGNYPDGGLFVWNLDGTLKQRITINHPNNVDVRYGLKLGDRLVDIAAVSLRDDKQIRIFKIDPITRNLSDINTLDSTNVLNKTFELPYGLTLYKRPTDGFIFVIVSSRHEQFKNQLWQIRLENDGTGRVKGVLVRTLGDYQSIVEGMVADDELGFLYASEEKVGIHKYHADPQKGSGQLALFATGNSLLDNDNNEGLALYKCANGTGYILVSDPGTHSIKVYRREGDPEAPHHHPILMRIKDDSSKAGDGLEVSNRIYTPAFPHGVVIWHDQAARNFRLYAWEDVAQQFLTICDGTTTAVEMGSAGAIDNAAFVILQQNSPNPFNPETEIHFALKKAGLVRLTIYNVLGEEVRRLMNTSLAPGTYNVRWDAKDNKGLMVGSGIYFYQLRADKFVETRRMVLSR